MLCQRDPYQTCLRTLVTSCQPYTGKARKGRKLWEVTLEQSPFYPEGGGQPSDTGSIAVLPSPSSSAAQAAPANAAAAVAVVDVQLTEDRGIVHYTTAAVSTGASVSAQVDWQRRFDHMQQHTGQHLVSAVADDVCGADTVSWELHERPQEGQAADESVSVDLSIASLSPEQISEIEQRCNGAIRNNRSVRQRVVVDLTSPDSLALLQSRQFRGTLPSADKMKGVLRLIDIEAVDINACGGTHVRSLGELQVLKLVGLERTKGCVRLKFLAGSRVIAALGRMLARETVLNKALGCGPADHAMIVGKLQAERKEAARTIKALQDELADIQGPELVAGLPETGGVAAYHRPDSDLPFLSYVARAASSANPNAVLLLTTTTGPVSGKANAAQEGAFLMVGPPELIKAAGGKAAAAMGGKGGGRPGLYQGKASNVEKASHAADVLKVAFAGEQ
ncbi:hypothetical protein WJX72_008928 [[Myrmecia] bisecta]|uniref:Alanyl-transfer RNA synthetases family profile domain-containing protein n=1 Tax=[Myrmecia] bisecta TaxID=41462 RepID=A0AAW1Q5A8_9CHLO